MKIKRMIKNTKNFQQQHIKVRQAYQHVFGEVMLNIVWKIPQLINDVSGEYEYDRVPVDLVEF